MTDNQSFTVTIYCDNCRTTGDYQFPKGTRLFRETGLCRETPNWIHLDSPNGQLVRCQFCGVPNELTMLERDEKAAREAAIITEMEVKLNHLYGKCPGCGHSLIKDHHAARNREHEDIIICRVYGCACEDFRA